MKTGKINSRQKGARGERQWRDELRANGFQARRGQQFSGSPDSPDVISDDLPWLHFEVKAVEHLNIYDAIEQAQRDCGGQPGKVESRKLKAEIADGNTSPQPSPQSGEGGDARGQRTEDSGQVPVVAHRRNHRPWLVTMPADVFFGFLRGDLPPESNDNNNKLMTDENQRK